MKSFNRLAFTLLIILLILFISVFFAIPWIKKNNFTRLIEAAANDPLLQNATVSITAAYEGDEESFIEYNSNKKIHPGSNFKLFTAAAALEKIGPDFTFKTRLFLSENEDFIIAGAGDPTFQQKNFSGFIEAVRRKGRIKGDIVFDDSVFTGERYGPGWEEEWRDQYFAVPITGLQINDNLLSVLGLADEKTRKFEITTAPLENYHPIIDQMNYVDDPDKLKTPVAAVLDDNGRLILRGDSMKELPFRTSAVIKDPSRITALVLKQELLKAHVISPYAKVLPLAGNPSKTLLFEHSSPPLKEIISRMLKYSKNNYAEALVRTLGKEIKKTGMQQAGVEILREFFKKINIPQEAIDALDGSGMAPDTRVTGSAIIKLFFFVNKRPWKDLFWNALPESNVDGTLKYRFENAGLKNRVIAKTGTHEFSSSLSGKILRETKKNIVFSIHIYNHPFSTEESVSRIVPIIDRLAAMLDRQF